jgi:hypothetical protein
VVVVVILVVVVVLVVELVVVVEVLVAASVLISVLGTSVVASFTCADDSVVVAATDCNSVDELDVLSRFVEAVVV